MADNNLQINRTNNTITWNTANRPMTGRVLSENEYGFLAESENGRCVYISKFVPQPRTNVR